MSVMLLAGCGSSGGAKDGEGAEGDAAGGGVETSGTGPGGSWVGAEALNNPDSPLYTKVIYFDFDVSSIRSEYISTLRAHAEYLVQRCRHQLPRLSFHWLLQWLLY